MAAHVAVHTVESGSLLVAYVFGAYKFPSLMATQDARAALQQAATAAIIALGLVCVSYYFVYDALLFAGQDTYRYTYGATFGQHARNFALAYTPFAASLIAGCAVVRAQAAGRAFVFLLLAAIPFWFAPTLNMMPL